MLGVCWEVATRDRDFVDQSLWFRQHGVLLKRDGDGDGLACVEALDQKVDCCCVTIDERIGIGNGIVDDGVLCAGPVGGQTIEFIFE